MCVFMHFFHFATFFLNTHSHSQLHTHIHIQQEHNLFISFFFFLNSFNSSSRNQESLFCVGVSRASSLLHHNSRITQACVLYTEEEVFFRDLCAVQLLSNPASTDAVVVIRRLCSKGSFKGVDPMLSPPWCQWDKSRQQLMYRGAVSVKIGRV